MTGSTVERTRPPLTGDERALLESFLDFHRATPRITCANLPAAPPSLPALSTPVRVVGHLRWLEHFWCEVVLAGRHGDAPYTEQVLHAEDEPAAGFPVPEGITIEQALDDYEAQCEASRAVLAGLDLDHEVIWHGHRTSVRWVYLHLIGETARHNGHLDTVRELINSTSRE